MPRPTTTTTYSMHFSLLLLFLHFPLPSFPHLLPDLKFGLSTPRTNIGLSISIGSGHSPSPSTPSSSSTPTSSSTPPLSSAYTALQAWKRSITSDPHNYLSSWVGPDVCSYRGVFCSDPPTSLRPSSSQVVAVIDLNKASLSGTLPQELSLLCHLTALHLNSNRFRGTIPDSLSTLFYLTELDLSNNLLSGPFPSPVLSFPSLVYLDLRFNSFSGPIPDDLFSTNSPLDAVLLNNNHFSGPVPSSLWTSGASVVNLANNRLAGPLPDDFGHPFSLIGVGRSSSSSSSLKEALFLNNAISGCIPEGVGLLSNLEVLDLSGNKLSGDLPGSLSCLSGIEVLNLAHNALSGVLSDVVCSLRSLVNLTVSFNFFSGFAERCADRLLSRGLGFDFSGNCIEGRAMQRPPPECSAGDSTSCPRASLLSPLVCIGPLGKEGTTAVHSP